MLGGNQSINRHRMFGQLRNKIQKMFDETTADRFLFDTGCFDEPEMCQSFLEMDSQMLKKFVEEGIHNNNQEKQWEGKQEQSQLLTKQRNCSQQFEEQLNEIFFSEPFANVTERQMQEIEQSCLRESYTYYDNHNDLDGQQSLLTRKSYDVHSISQIKSQIIKSNLIEEKHQQDLLQEHFGYYQKALSGHFGKYKKFLKSFGSKSVEEFLSQYRIYRECYEILSLEQIQENSQNYENLNRNFLKQIQLVDSAIYHTKNYRLRITQIMAIYFFLHKPNCRRLILQILTGQGKSVTICCLAAILTLRGQTVDIVTTNKVLAQRDAHQNRVFYERLNLGVMNNFSENQRQQQQRQKPKKCYERGVVVYGTPFTYQIDILFDEYKRKGTRNKRKFETLIIDEVDSMFIDEKENQTILSTQYSGFSELLAPMKIIFQQILDHTVAEEEGRLMFYVNSETQGELMKCEVNEALKKIIDKIRKEFDNEIIPEWRMEFVEISLEKWIRSAIQAIHVYKENVHYMIENGNIVPVDYKNTGALQRNVHWNNGLHQFLQMKHRLPESVESMSSNFMSNIAHFLRYSRIYGLTGTLGSEKSLKFLQNVYQVEILQIPSFKERLLKINPGYLQYDENRKIKRVEKQVSKMMDQGRSVLIICESIEEVGKIVKRLKKTNGDLKKKIKVIETGEENHDDNVDAKEIIVATNIAGRGTDLKPTQELLRNGGLHVIVTFMPLNLRVEMQARGRAGRKGQPGSSELIVSYLQFMKQNYQSSNVLEEYQFNKKFSNGIQGLMSVRDTIEEELMKGDYERVERLKTRDQIFQMYSMAVHQIADFQENKAKRNAIEECWAMFLKKIELWQLSDEQIKEEAKGLTEKFIKQSESFYNPSHYVSRGINFLRNKNEKKAAVMFERSTKNTNAYCEISGIILGGAASSNISKVGNSKQNKDLKKFVQKGIPRVEELVQKRKDINIAKQNIGTALENHLDDLEQIQRNSKQLSHLQGISMIGNGMKLMQNLPKVKSFCENDLLDALTKRLKNIQETYSNLKPGQRLEFDYEPIHRVLDEVQGKQGDIQNILRKLAPQIPCIPVPRVKKGQKSQKPWWHGRLIFCLGVAQIAVGAAIVYYSAGSLTSFGASMMTSGFQDVFGAIFNSEDLPEINQYFTQKSFQYTFSLLCVGFKGVKQLAEIGQKVYKCNSYTEVLKGGMKIYLEQEGVQGFLKQQVFRGISQWNKKDQRFKGADEANKQEIISVLKSSEMRKVSQLVKSGADQVQKCQQEGLKIKKVFEEKSEQKIRKMVDLFFQKKPKNIEEIELSERQMQIVIDQAFKKAYQNISGKKDRSKLFENIKMLIDFDGYSPQQLSQRVIVNFEMEKLIKETIRGTVQTQSFKKKSIQLLEIQIIKAMKICWQDERQRIIQQTPHQVKKLNQSVDKINEWVQKGLMMGELQKRGILVESMTQIDLNSTEHSDLQRWVKNALFAVTWPLQKKKRTEDHDFREYLVRVVYEKYAGVAVKALVEVFHEKSNSDEKLKQIKELYRKGF